MYKFSSSSFQLFWVYAQECWVRWPGRGLSPELGHAGTQSGASSPQSWESYIPAAYELLGRRCFVKSGLNGLGWSFCLFSTLTSTKPTACIALPSMASVGAARDVGMGFVRSYCCVVLHHTWDTICRRLLGTRT